MPQIFSPRATILFRVVLIGAPLALGAILFAAFQLIWSPYVTDVGHPVAQQVPFSHEHHVSGLGIDCRYCHTTVEKAAFAGIPPTSTCMTCHSQIWTEAPILAAVRTSQATRTPLEWNRAHDLPDFVYFNHSIHIKKGIACAHCHGRVEEMPLVWKERTLQMGWCLECHRHPEPFLRPPAQVFNLNWKPEEDTERLGRTLAQQQQIRSPRELSDCTTCHR
jgi:Cytochrome c7 and related cytochrome c